MREGSLKNWLKEKPFAVTLFFCLVFLGIDFLAIFLGQVFVEKVIPGFDINFNKDFFSETLTSVVLIILAYFSGCLDSLRGKGYKKSGMLVTVTFPLVFFMTDFVYAFLKNYTFYFRIQTPYSAVVFGVLSFIFVGFSEELICRGIILNLLKNRLGDSSKDIWTSVILSSFIFGCAHFSNLFTGRTLWETLIQVIYATTMGLVFGAIFVRCGSIWPGAILHSLCDVCGLVTVIFFKFSLYYTNSSASLSNLNLCIPEILLAVFLLRKGKDSTQITNSDSKFQKALSALIIAMMILLIITFAILMIYLHSLSIPELSTFAKKYL